MSVRQCPVFGVITTTVPRRQDARSRSGLYVPGNGWRHLEKAAHELGLSACLFRPEDVEVKRRRVQAFVCQRTAAGETWKRTYLRLPDVVYENVFVHQSKHLAVAKARRLFRKLGTPLFNPPLGDKAALADWLRPRKALWEHHPETQLLETEADLFAYLERYEAVYVKPVWGSAGEGILEVRAGEDGSYRVRAAKYGKEKVPITRRYSREKLCKFLRRTQRRTRCIVQAGCDLLHVDGCKIDLRTHLQRGADGEWQCVAVIVKRGQQHSIVSNYHAGGSTHDVAWLQERAAEMRFDKLPDEEQIVELSEAIAAAYAEKAPMLGSIGLDLGIDTDGRLWLLDVNSRPGRNILDAEQKARCQRLNAAFAAFLWKQKSGSS